MVRSGGGSSSLICRATIALVLASLDVAGCADDPVAARIPAASLSIESDADSVGFRESIQLRANPLAADQRPVKGAIVLWSSSDTSVLTVSESGVVTGRWLGSAYVRAVSGSARDSARIAVVSASGYCGGNGFLRDNANAFAGSIVLPARTYILHDPPRYHGTLMWYGAGIIYGTDDTNLAVGYLDVSSPDLWYDSVCEVSDSARGHSVSALRVRSASGKLGPRADIPGLLVVQEHFDFTDAVNSDYLLMRHTFTNNGSSPVQQLRVGVFGDLDLALGGDNVGGYDAALSAATVIARDSTVHTDVMGFKLIDLSTQSYSPDLINGMSMNRIALMGYLKAGITNAAATPPRDVKQIVAGEPFSLQPGESRTVWYAVAIGVDRAAFNAHMLAAEAKVQALKAR